MDDIRIQQEVWPDKMIRIRIIGKIKAYPYSYSNQFADTSTFPQARFIRSHFPSNTAVIHSYAKLKMDFRMPLQMSWWHVSLKRSIDPISIVSVDEWSKDCVDFLYLYSHGHHISLRRLQNCTQPGLQSLHPVYFIWYHTQSVHHKWHV